MSCKPIACNPFLERLNASDPYLARYTLFAGTEAFPGLKLLNSILIKGDGLVPKVSALFQNYDSKAKIYFNKPELTGRMREFKVHHKPEEIPSIHSDPPWPGLPTSASVFGAVKEVLLRFSTMTPTSLTLNVSTDGAGSGIVSGTGISCPSDCSETYPSGTNVALTASANSNSVFGGWSGCTSISGTTCNVTMDGGKIVMATFNAVAPPQGDLDPPNLQSPSNGQIGVSTVPTFRWSQVVGADHGYVIAVATSSSELPTVNSVSTCSVCKETPHSISSTSYSGSNFNLSPGRTYYWKVRGRPKAETPYGNWSATYSFTTDGSTTPPAPTGVVATPGNGEVTIGWDTVTGADSYNLYWNTTTPVTKTTGLKITGVTSPYVHIGRTNGVTYYYVVTAVNSAGSESNGSTGVSATPSAPHPSFNHARGLDGPVAVMAPASDDSGDIYVGGGFTSSIARLNADGTVDSGFAIGTGFNGSVAALVLASDGDIYVGGGFTSYNGTSANNIIRLNADGTVDSIFIAGYGFNNSVAALALAPDRSGDIYVGGYFTSYNGFGANYIIRLNADGGVDSNFAIGDGFNDSVAALALTSDGSGDIYAGGKFTSYNGTGANRIIRLNADGGRYSGFTASLLINIPTNARILSQYVSFLIPALDGSGDIYVGGSFTSYNGIVANHIIRLNANGGIDSGFATGAGFNGSVTALALDGSGDVYAGGGFTSYNGIGTNRIIRLNTDGGIDFDFVAIGTGFSYSVSSLVSDGSGDIYAGGEFWSYNGTSANKIIRLNADGGIDSDFSIGTGFNNSVRVLMLASDGSGDIYVGGDFTTYKNVLVERIARLGPDGTLY